MFPEPVDEHAGGQRIVAIHQPLCQTYSRSALGKRCHLEKTGYIWLHHVELFNGGDGLLDLRGATEVTLSWSHLHTHKKAMLMAWDNDQREAGGMYVPAYGLRNRAAPTTKILLTSTRMEIDVPTASVIPFQQNLVGQAPNPAHPDGEVAGLPRQPDDPGLGGDSLARAKG